MTCNCKCKCDSHENNHTDEKYLELKKYMDKLKTTENPKSHLIAILHKVQNLYGYLNKEILKNVADYMCIPMSKIWGVATFYHYFNLHPVGKHVISVCLGTACYVKGADKVLDAIKDELKIDEGQTTKDKLFSLHKVRCIGACGIAPVMTIGDKVYGEVKPEQVKNILKDYQK